MSTTEREMLALRTNLRRLVRCGSGHSKSREHHTAAVAAFATWANFCRPSSALKGKTPAMVSGLADHRWTTIEYVEACLLAEPCEPPAPVPLARRAVPEMPARVCPRDEHRARNPARQARGCRRPLRSVETGP
jgi:hypothetical protein